MRALLLCALCALLAGLAAGGGRAASAPSATLGWVGWDDQVGTYWQGTPDGYRDGRFALTVRAPGETVTGIALNPVKPDGNPALGHTWNTTPKDGKWILGVVRGSVRLNATDVPICDEVGAGPAVYGLFAEDDGAFKAGAPFRVTLTLASGATVTADTTVGDVAGGPPAAPRPYALPSAPAPDAVGACVSSGLGTAAPPTTTTTTAKKPPAKKPAAKTKTVPVCRKGQRSTKAKPCRKP